MTHNSPHIPRYCGPLTLLACSIIVISVTAGCSRITTAPKEPVRSQEAYKASAMPQRDISIEELESDPEFMSDQEPGIRAIEISRMWHEHGTQLERSSYSGAFAAHTRSAHIALTQLLGETCKTPFYPPCHELDRAYKRAIDALARLLARHSWHPPDLERTRYRLTLESGHALSSLRDWHISFDQPSHENVPTRPGLGLATVGCRRLRVSDTTCSPLTFVITFSADPSSEVSQVSFQAFDAFQQEVITVGASSIPLAAAIEQTAISLGSLGANSANAALYCLSAPTSNAPTVVLFIEASDSVAASRSILAPLIRDPEFTSRASLCSYSLGTTTGRDLSPRTIAESLRRAHAGITSESLANNYRHSLSIVAVGDRPTRVALAFANRISRIKPPHLRRPSADIRFIPESLTIISSAGSDILPFESTDLPTYQYKSPCDHACLHGIKESSRRDYSQQQLSEDQDGAAHTAGTEDLPLSPIM